MSDQAVIDRLPEAIVILRGQKIVNLNRRARELLFPPDTDGASNLVGRNISDVLTLLDDAGDRLVCPTQPPLVGSRFAERVVQVVRPSGRKIVAMSGAWDGGELILTFRSAGRRDALGRLQGDVVATVAHELRSPLTSVKGFTSTLLARWERFDDEQKQQMLRTIEADADRVTRLLSDLLEVSRIDAGRVKLHRSLVDVTSLARTVVAKARMNAPTQTIDVVSEADLGHVSADRDKVEQILTNLIDNAIKHGGGTSVVVTVAGRDDEVRVTVADLGPGIDQKLASRLFSKFGRGRDVHHPGTGLGLFLTRGLVTAHGGRIWFDPDVVEGATVHVALPRDRS